MAAIMGYAECLRILCTREYQVSIKESFHAELKAAIEMRPWLARHYDVGIDYLRGANGTEFIFRGLGRNLRSIKSLSGIDLCIVEEAEDVDEEAWRVLPQTIRKPKSEIWPIWNPKTEGSPVDRRFRQDLDDKTLVAELNYTDNPWFPDVLEEERRRDMARLDPATYAWIWEGDYLRNSASQILSGKVRVADFEPDAKKWDGPYHGLDFGFAQDPTAAVKCWVYGDTLYIEQEAGSVGLELDDTAEYVIDRMPGIDRHVIRADSARPESISYLRRKGLGRIEGVNKWKGSVEDGIQHLRSYKEIVIHPRCEQTRREAMLWSYKTDRATGDILPQVVDAHNHYWDAVRYALEPLIRRKGVDYRALTRM